MARSTRMSVQKRQREQKKAEKAALKREQRRASPAAERATDVASANELEGYGVLPHPFRDERRD